MAVTYNTSDGTHEDNTDSPNTVSGHTISGAERLLVVCIGGDIKLASGASVATMIWDVATANQSLIKLAEQNSTTRARSEIWYLPAPVTGALDLTITYNTDYITSCLAMMTFNGVDPDTPFGTVVKGFDDDISSDTISISANGMGVGMGAQRETDTVLQNRDERANFLATGGGSSRLACQTTDLTGSIALTWDWTQTWDITHISVPIEPVAAGGGRIMSSLAHKGGLAGAGGIAGQGGGLAG